MKRSLRIMNIYLLVLLGMFSLFSCKNNKPVLPSFSAAGYWSDVSTLGIIEILNRPDGTGRLYLVNGTDTASATHIYEGKYTVRGNTFRFQTNVNGDNTCIYLETKRNLSGSMSGVLTIRTFPKKHADFAFQNIKKPKTAMGELDIFSKLAQVFIVY